MPSSQSCLCLTSVELVPVSPASSSLQSHRVGLLHSWPCSGNALILLSSLLLGDLLGCFQVCYPSGSSLEFTAKPIQPSVCLTCCILALWNRHCQCCRAFGFSQSFSSSRFPTHFALLSSKSSNCLFVTVILCCYPPATFWSFMRLLLLTFIVFWFQVTFSRFLMVYTVSYLIPDTANTVAVVSLASADLFSLALQAESSLFWRWGPAALCARACRLCFPAFSQLLSAMLTLQNCARELTPREQKPFRDLFQTSVCWTNPLLALKAWTLCFCSQETCCLGSPSFHLHVTPSWAISSRDALSSSVFICTHQGHFVLSVYLGLMRRPCDHPSRPQRMTLRKIHNFKNRSSTYSFLH